MLRTSAVSDLGRVISTDRSTLDTVHMTVEQHYSRYTKHVEEIEACMHSFIDAHREFSQPG